MESKQTNRRESIIELRKKISELKKLSDQSDIDMSEAIETLNRELEAALRVQSRELSPWERVQLARDPERPYTLDYIDALFTDFLELSGDRAMTDDKSIVGGMAKFNGRSVMVIGTQKGRDTKENLVRNFGWPGPEGYRKAGRLMRLADKLELPIITLIDTPGAFPGIASEERHVGEAIAANLRDMFSLKVPLIAVIIGEGGSGGALGLGVGNRILVLENAYYSVITPEGCAAILWKDRKFAPQAAEALQLTSDKLLALGVADEVVTEPVGGAQEDHAQAARLLGEVLERQLKELSKFSATKLVNQRYEKFRRIGKFAEGALSAGSEA